MAKKQRLSVASDQAKRNSQVPYYARGSGDVQEGTGENFHAPVVHSHEPPEDATASDRELEEALDRELWDYSDDGVKDDIDVDLMEEEEKVSEMEEDEEVPENDEDEDVEDKWDDKVDDTSDSEADSDMYAPACWK